MKHNEALQMANSPNLKTYSADHLHLVGDHHVATSKETPVCPEAFEVSEEERMAKIALHFREIMQTLGLDLSDDSLRGTPQRVAKMFVKEVFYGLDPKNKPEVTLFENKFDYNQMLVERNIKVHSFCEHHFVPIVGRAHSYNFV